MSLHPVHAAQSAKFVLRFCALRIEAPLTNSIATVAPNSQIFTVGLSLRGACISKKKAAGS